MFKKYLARAVRAGRASGHLEAYSDDVGKPASYETAQPTFGVIAQNRGNSTLLSKPKCLKKESEHHRTSKYVLTKTSCLSHMQNTDQT